MVQADGLASSAFQISPPREDLSSTMRRLRDNVKAAVVGKL